ncbi:HAD family hydrolase [Heyndrickxia oleronia]|jgi:HAD superfamily hydrolase (TIGR01509 family)|uniref:HAD family phosphatase n=1 Tax=Heyndrickxia oleronia TaxID=38875 RepID=A0AAW6SWC0_9BACI|nr:HAD family phosphatase [Heyndrickxia oleronia]MCI1589984.1 HAD family phosphatase [Heyndrickxia oleronia]MCI1613390.1 HAD family phosphatase [Heyndrickxia oleronia]MCI1744702.1 HAD family phosphatase [Heyndrickxia oleronia]MCI1761339.1 HAD family phosphatase [Heyndrickxia oleronia]MDH5160879.1 HAD family phosphatase [Heyndrickxia oleronia]
MNPIQLVIFDMDGLLFDTERPSFLAMEEVMKKQGYQFTIENYRQMIGLSGPKSNIVLQEIYGKDFQFHRISDDYNETFKRILDSEGLAIKPGAKELLDAIEQKGLKKCIASSSSRETIQQHLIKTGLESRFDFFVSGDEVEFGKPHPDIFIEACNRANEKPDSALVLEDSLNGLKAAHGANIKCIIVPDLIQPNEEMKQKAFSIVKDLSLVVSYIE